MRFQPTEPDWKAFLEYDAQGSQTAEYYLKETETGFISDKKTAEFKIDTGLPTGEIKIKDNGFTELLNAITFNYFFKNTVDVTITGADATSIRIRRRIPLLSIKMIRTETSLPRSTVMKSQATRKTARILIST